MYSVVQNTCITWQYGFIRRKKPVDLAPLISELYCCDLDQSKAGISPWSMPRWLPLLFFV